MNFEVTSSASGYKLINGREGLLSRCILLLVERESRMSCRSPCICANGPVVGVVSVCGVSPAGHRFWFFSRKVVPAGQPPWRGFCKSWYEVGKQYECRGAILISCWICLGGVILLTAVEQSGFVTRYAVPAKWNRVQQKP